MRLQARSNTRGFTLIELLIVVGIVSLLLVVLVVAVLPWISKSRVNQTKTLLNTIYTGLPIDSGILTPQRFKNDAGSMANQIHSDEKIASSQMILFYLAPSRDVWVNSKLYAGRNYDPPNPPESFGDSLRTEANRMPWLIDAWDKELWYRHDKNVNLAYVQSAGPDGIWDNDDDLVYDPRSQSVKEFAEMARR